MNKHKKNDLGDAIGYERLQEVLASDDYGYDRCHYYEQTQSTQRDAREFAQSQRSDGMVFLAETQTAGRGRNERVWVSPKGAGLYTTLVLEPKLEVDQLSLFSLVGAIAGCEAIASVSELNARVKWPNDVVVNGKKVGGLLLECFTRNDGTRVVLIGLGLNVNTLPAVLPDRPVFPASSLYAEASGTRFSRVDILANWLKRMRYWRERLERGEVRCVCARWVELAEGLGRCVQVHQETGLVKGILRGISDAGVLLVEAHDGVVYECWTGDVLFE